MYFRGRHAKEAEVEGLKLKMEAAKERESLLSFALSAAEKGNAARSLQPPGERAASVDRKLSKQLKELEQRARRDTAGISAKRLEEMLPEAKRKQLAAAERRAALLAELLVAAGVDGAEAKGPSTRDLLRASNPVLESEGAGG